MKNNIQSNENKTALYQYIIRLFLFSFVFIDCSRLVLIWCIFVSRLFLKFDSNVYLCV